MRELSEHTCRAADQRLSSLVLLESDVPAVCDVIDAHLAQEPQRNTVFHHLDKRRARAKRGVDVEPLQLDQSAAFKWEKEAAGAAPPAIAPVPAATTGAPQAAVTTAVPTATTVASAAVATTAPPATATTAAPAAVATTAPPATTAAATTAAAATPAVATAALTAAAAAPDT